ELRTTVDDMPARIAALMEERKKLERDLSDARKKLAMGGGATNGGAAAGGVRDSTRSNWCARAPKRSVARVAAAGPTWRRPVAPMGPRPTRRCRRSSRRWL